VGGHRTEPAVIEVSVTGGPVTGGSDADVIEVGGGGSGTGRTALVAILLAVLLAGGWFVHRATSGPAATAGAPLSTADSALVGSDIVAGLGYSYGVDGTSFYASFPLSPVGYDMYQVTASIEPVAGARSVDALVVPSADLARYDNGAPTPPLLRTLNPDSEASILVLGRIDCAHPRQIDLAPRITLSFRSQPYAQIGFTRPVQLAPSFEDLVSRWDLRKACGTR